LALILAARPLPVTSPIRAHHLNRRHQWIGERHRPEHVEAKLGTGLGIGRNATGIVVGSTRDQAGAQLKKAMARMTLTESLGQRMPLQSLLAGLELLAFVNMVISSQLPVLELHEKQVEFPGIHGSGGDAWQG
jgi:hypothetical protein